MWRKGGRWLWNHRRLSLAAALLLALILVNLVAFMHAYAMTHFTTSGVKTRKPDALSGWEKLQVLFTGVNIPRPVNTRTPQSVGLPFTVHRFNSTDGLALEAWHVICSPSKGLVLMFHGYSACKASLLREAQVIHHLGYDAFLVDFRGSGGSDGAETTIGVREAGDVVAAWDYARKEWPGQPVCLFGQSMGSAAILRAIAIHGIEPGALILECPFDRMLSTVENRFAAMHWPGFPAAHLLVWWGGVQQGFNGFEHNPINYAKRVTCPVLMLHGSDDPNVTRGQAESIFASLNGDKYFEILAGVGHTSYVDAQPESWQRHVQKFLERVVTSSRP
jgi:alpha-beta hydrolase superfamily lysophospholipase